MDWHRILRIGHVKVLLLAVYVLVIIAVLKFTNVAELLVANRIEELVLGWGILGPLLFILLFILNTVLFMPSIPLAVLGGFLFGPFAGAAYTILGATLGAIIVYALLGFLGRDFVEEKLEHQFHKFKEYESKVEEKGFVTVLLLRLIPLFPFNFLNISLSFTNIRFRDFALATFFGIMPACVILVNIGHAARDVSSAPFYLFIGLFILLALSPFVYEGFIKKRGV